MEVVGLREHSLVLCRDSQVWLSTQGEARLWLRLMLGNAVVGKFLFLLPFALS